MTKALLTSALIVITINSRSLASPEIPAPTTQEIPEEITIDRILENKQWSALKLKNHKSTLKEACMAETQTNESRLEVYAEKSEFEGYVQPVVQISLKANSPVLGGEIKFDRRRQSFLFTGDFSQPTNSEFKRVVTRLQDQDDILRELKIRNQVTATFRLKNGETLTKTFSLIGSSRTIGELGEACSLNL